MTGDTKALVEQKKDEQETVDDGLVDNDLVDNDLVDDDLVDNDLVDNDLDDDDLVDDGLVDNDLVEKAYTKISNIFYKKFEHAIMKSGRYLLKEFYDNKIELARAGNPSKSGSLNRLIQKLRNTSPDSPSKSWIYNSIGLVVQEFDVKKMGHDCFQTYGKLSISHKILLLPIADKEKKDLINKAFNEKLSVRKLNKAMKELKLNDEEDNLLTILNNPAKLSSEKNIKKIDIESLEKESLENLNRLKNEAIKRRQEINEKHIKYNEKIKKHTLYLSNFDKLVSNIDKVLATKTTDPVNNGD